MPNPARPASWLRRCGAWQALSACAWLLAGCAGLAPPPATPVDAPTLRAADAHFGVAPALDEADAALRISPAMRDYLDRHIQPALRRGGDPRRVLLDALFDQRQLRLEYDGGPTRHAADAFDARRGNCLSLVLMTTALAEELGLRVRPRLVATSPALTRHGGLVMAAAHVNLSLATSTAVRQVAGPGGSPEWVIDFLPGQDLGRQVVRELRREQVQALYLNNRAAEALAGGDLARAHALARAALLVAPGETHARNTLGVVWQRAGLLDAAEQVFRGVLTDAPDQLAALTNLHALLRQRNAPGDAVQAAAVAERLARLEPHAPFADDAAGREALAAGRFADARAAFARQLTRTPEDPQVHHAMAVALLGLGDADGARDHLTHARRLSTTEPERLRYHAKLAALRGG